MFADLVAAGMKLVVNQRRVGVLTMEIIKCGRASRQTEGASIRNEKWGLFRGRSARVENRAETLK